MIRVRKPTTAPAVLTRSGARKRRKHCDDVATDPGAYRSGKARLAFDAKIYGHKDVKDALKTAQHGKCAFCESKFEAVAFGDVEHFRPKGGYQQEADDPLSTPGYYWLAYEWSNLYASCQICNQAHKKNWFPLADPAKRATGPDDDHRLEPNLVIDPGEEEPEGLIGFRDEVPFPLGDEPRVRATIGVFGLDRPKLEERRREYLDRLKVIHQLAERPPEDPSTKEARAFLVKQAAAKAEYASMVRCFLRKVGYPAP